MSQRIPGMDDMEGDDKLSADAYQKWKSTCICRDPSTPYSMLFGY